MEMSSGSFVTNLWRYATVDGHKRQDTELFFTVWDINNVTFEFSLNVFTEFAEFSDKNICHYNKRAQTCHPATSCVRDQDAITVPARHM